jgi:drug/metabolite transporter (DMT)-like permease
MAESTKNPAARVDDVPRGILLMIGATVLFALSSAAAKWLVAVYPIGEVMFLRSFSAMAVCAVVILPVTGLSVFATRRPRDHIARGLSQSISQTCTVVAFWLMPLAGAIAINFSAPLFSAIVAIFFLKERAGLARWAALFAGFFGVLIVTNPGAGRYRPALVQRHHLGDRTVFMDASPVVRAGYRGLAVLLSASGVGDGDRLPGVG